MARRLSRRAQRLLIAHLLVSLAKETFTHIFSESGANFGAQIDAVFVAACVTIGHADGRAMTAMNIADYLDMPRSTVLRKLDLLTRRDIITREGNRYFLSPEEVERSKEYLDRVTAMIASTTASLS